MLGRQSIRRAFSTATENPVATTHQERQRQRLPPVKRVACEGGIKCERETMRWVQSGAAGIAGVLHLAEAFPLKTVAGGTREPAH